MMNSIVKAALCKYPAAIYQTTEGRRLITRNDPMMFALIYMRHHLKDQDGNISFADFHTSIYEHAKTWTQKTSTPASNRDAYIAPRNCGKSTVLFGILPMWAAAHKHATFIAAFSHTGTQAEQHLQTFKTELKTNPLLAIDYPELCEPLKLEGARKVVDRRDMIRQSNGFIFVAKGIDTGVLGMKVGAHRPDLILCDDIEPPEGVYSAYQCKQRLNTLIDAIMPLNVYARVVIVGTTVMAGSIIHDLVKCARKTDTPAPWITAENIRSHYYPAIVANDDGTERSCWPEKWPISYLESIRDSRQYAKNYANDPVADEGAYWCADDIKIGDIATCTKWLIEIDPAVTTKRTSDYTGVAVVAYSPSEQKCVIHEAHAVKMTGRELLGHIVKLLDKYPQVKTVRIETNQGGDIWHTVLSPLPATLKTVHNTEPKEQRATKALKYWQTGQVYQARPLKAWEEQALAYPNVANDDIIDAVGSAVRFFLGTRPPRRSQSTSYI